MYSRVINKPDILSNCQDKVNITSEKFNIGEYMNRFHISVVSSNNSNSSTDFINNDFADLLKIPTCEIEELEKANSISDLDCSIDVPQITGNTFARQKKCFRVTAIPTEAANLKTIQCLKESKTSKSTSKDTAIQRDLHLKYRSNARLYNLSYTNANTDLTPARDYMIVVRIYKPFFHEAGKRNFKFPKFALEVAFLGGNNLSMLRDVIRCPNDLTTGEEISDDPYKTTTPDARPGFLFINNTFYNDTRNVLNKDYSKTVIDWAKNNVTGSEFHSAVLEDTTFSDLTVQLGYPCVYQHHGNCEHLFLFSEIKLLDSNDSLSKKDYPMVRCLANDNVTYCMVCTKFQAKKITIDNPRVPHRVFYWCNECFLTANYIDGRKVGHFKAYRFYDRVV